MRGGGQCSWHRVGAGHRLPLHPEQEAGLLLDPEANCSISNLSHLRNIIARVVVSPWHHGTAVDHWRQWKPPMRLFLFWMLCSTQWKEDIYGPINTRISRLNKMNTPFWEGTISGPPYVNSVFLIPDHRFSTPPSPLFFYVISINSSWTKNTDNADITTLGCTALNPLQSIQYLVGE